jgi:hypothetical protein
MLEVDQLKNSMIDLSKTLREASKEFDDPFYIAWMVETIFDGKAPALEVADKYPEVMRARRSKPFRKFWEKFREAEASLSNFQTLNMGIVPERKRSDYVRKFRKEHPDRPPF